MERRAVIKTLLRQLLKILHMVRRYLRIKLQHHITFARLDDGDFLRGGRGGLRLFLRHWFGRFGLVRFVGTLAAAH